MPTDVPKLASPPQPRDGPPRWLAQMAKFPATHPEARLAMKFTGVSLLGFVTDLIVLRVGMALGLEAAWARVISLFCAMQVTFVINGLHVFRTLDRSNPFRQWATYMGSNGFGNVCNYWIFLTLVSTHWRLVSAAPFALCVGAFTAWVLNYACARFLVFRPIASLALKVKSRNHPPET
jgi:putative flippase GtrA